MSTPEGRKSPKHERVTRATTAAAAAASKAPAQTATAAASKAKEEDFDDDSRINRLETDIKVLQRTDSILVGEISELKELITVLSR